MWSGVHVKLGRFHHRVHSTGPRRQSAQAPHYLIMFPNEQDRTWIQSFTFDHKTSGRQCRRREQAPRGSNSNIPGPAANGILSKLRRGTQPSFQRIKNSKTLMSHTRKLQRENIRTTQGLMNNAISKGKRLFLELFLKRWIFQCNGILIEHFHCGIRIQ